MEAEKPSQAVSAEVLARGLTLDWRPELNEGGWEEEKISYTRKIQCVEHGGVFFGGGEAYVGSCH